MYCSIPSIFGLGVLWYGNGATQEMTQKVEQLSKDFGRLKPFLSILEFNRIVLLEKLQETGELLERAERVFIAAQNRQIEDLVETRKSWRRRMPPRGASGPHSTSALPPRTRSRNWSRHARSWSRRMPPRGASGPHSTSALPPRTAGSKELVEKNAAQGREWAAQKKYIGELVSRNVNLDLKIMELESVFGWLRHKVRKALPDNEKNVVSSYWLP